MAPNSYDFEVLQLLDILAMHCTDLVTNSQEVLQKAVKP